MIVLTTQQFDRFLASACLCLVAASAWAEWIDTLGHEELLLGFYAIVSLSYEQNLLVWYLTLLYGLAAGLSLLASHESKDRSGNASHWILLGLVFAGLALNNFTGIGAPLQHQALLAWHRGMLEDAIIRFPLLSTVLLTSVVATLLGAAILAVRAVRGWAATAEPCRTTVPLALACALALSMLPDAHMADLPAMAIEIGCASACCAGLWRHLNRARSFMSLQIGATVHA